MDKQEKTPSPAPQPAAERAAQEPEVDATRRSLLLGGSALLAATAGALALGRGAKETGETLAAAPPPAPEPARNPKGYKSGWLATGFPSA